MIETLLDCLRAWADERRALAELHRANARRALEAPGAASSSKPFACTDRWAECVFADVQDTEGRVVDHELVVKSFTCETHGCAVGVSCPEELPKQAPKPDAKLDAELDALALETPGEGWLETRETEAELERQAQAAE